jgi:hypothetical protein
LAESNLTKKSRSIGQSLKQLVVFRQLVCKEPFGELHRKEWTMTLPALIFGGLVATLLGALFHLWRGGNFGRLVLYIILSWIGFWIGQLAAGVVGWGIINVGPLHLGMSILGSLIVLGIGYWLSLIQMDKTDQS